MTRWLRFQTLNGNWTVAHAFKFEYGGAECGRWPRVIPEELAEGKPPRGWKRCKRCENRSVAK